MTNGNISVQSSQQVAGRGRNCGFWFTAKPGLNGTYKIHMHADYIKSLDYNTNADPFDECRRLHASWLEEIK